VLYRCETLATGFWDGLAVDKQMIDTRGSADYWIRDFLASDLKNTAAAGTKRVAAAFQLAIRDAKTTEVRQELVAASQTMKGREGRITSAQAIAADLSDVAQVALKAAFPRPELYAKTFKFKISEFESNLLFRSVELDNGVTIIAENTKFDEVVEQEIAARGDRRRFSTVGKVIDERLRKSR